MYAETLDDLSEGTGFAQKTRMSHPFRATHLHPRLLIAFLFL